MEMQNITLSLPINTLRKNKIIAAERQTSVPRLLTQALESIADEETGNGKAKDRQFGLLKQGFFMGLGDNKPANRESLHER